MIYVGTCGYSYADWVGTFYPPATKPDEMLRYYVSQFPAVEIDSSYYWVPGDRTIAAMDRRTPKEFRFSFKAPRTVVRPPEGRVHVHDDARLLADVVTPLRESGKLACILLQFPNGFRRTPTTESYLQRAIEIFDPLAVVVEFRHVEWQNNETLELLRDAGASLCNVDMPRHEELPHPSSDATGPIGYVRFHGRNSQAWWTGTNVTRYDHSYTPEELEPWTERLVEIDAQVKESYAFFNNHARGNAPRNAEMFEELLHERFGMMWDTIVAEPAVKERMPQTPSLFDDLP